MDELEMSELDYEMNGGKKLCFSLVEIFLSSVLLILGIA